MRLIITLFVFVAMASSAFADKVSGTLYGIGAEGEKAPLASANLYWLGTDKGTISDADGKFELHTVRSTSMLVASYTGYEKDTIDVNKIEEKLDITIELESNLQTETVNVVDVHPTRHVNKVSIANQETISEAGLKKAACCNLAESFVTNASVDVEYSDASTGARQIKLLGLHGTYTQILTENVPNLRGLGFPFGLNYIPGPWMESISISKGAASVKNGYESITGQINVEYKKANTSEPLFLNFYADNYQKVEGNITSAVDLSDKWSTMLLFHGNFMNNKMDRNSDYFLDHPMVEQINLLNRWDYNGDSHESKTGIKLLYENRYGGQPGFYPGREDQFYGIDINSQRAEFYTKNGFFLGDNASIGTIFSATHHKQNSFYGRKHYLAEQNSIYGNFMYQGDINHENAFTTGFSFQYDKYSQHLDDLNLPKEELVPGAFLEYTFSGIHDFTLTGGLRYDHHNNHGGFVTPRLHAKYDIDADTKLRASAGKGYRTADLIAENSSVMASSRQLIIAEELDMEEAWNYGLNFLTEFSTAGIWFTFNADYFRTEFINQVVTDLDDDFNQVRFYNLDGESYSNSLQFDLAADFLNGFILTTAYRWNDVRMTIDGELRQKPLQSPHKGFMNLEYILALKGWSFDITGEYNSSGRMPDSEGMPADIRPDDTFPGYFLAHGQVTKDFDALEIYLGIENAFDYRQDNPIVGWQDPFGNYFDSSMIWGPVAGRKIYMGVRMTVN
ncbi:MAG: TonB-dependent receptor domain-containing protein [Candidatus Kapaibacterium sp.]